FAGAGPQDEQRGKERPAHGFSVRESRSQRSARAIPTDTLACLDIDWPTDRDGVQEKERWMQKRLVTRYGTKDAEAADENQRRIEAVFAQLDEDKPGNVSYIVLRLADDSFVHVSFHGH